MIQEISPQVVTLQTNFAQNLWSGAPSAHSAEFKALGLTDFARGVKLIQERVDDDAEQAANDRIAQIVASNQVLKDSLLAEHKALTELGAVLPDSETSQKQGPLQHIVAMSYPRNFVHPQAELACDCLIQFDELMLLAIVAREEELIENKKFREYRHEYPKRFRGMFQLAHVYKRLL